ncbi:MAG: NAD(P)/FAD-dependent oxidoreductase [Nocardioides sp.]
MTRTRALVVGAGVIGGGVALELARAGFETLLIDAAGGPGQGSTSASSAIVRYHYDHAPEVALAWEAGRRWQAWERYLGVRDPVGMASFVRSGALVLDGPGFDLAAQVRLMRDQGIEVHELDGGGLRERFPAVEPRRLGPPSRPDQDQFWADPREELTAFFVPSAGHVDDPALAARNLAFAATAAGAACRYRARVVEVLRDRDRVRGVRLDDGTSLRADVVVNAAGPWSGRLNELAGVLGDSPADFRTSTRPLQQEVISLPAPDGFTLGAGGTCVTDPDFATYFRPHAGGTLIAGGMEPECDELTYLDRPEDAIESVTAATWETQTLRLARRLPALGIPGRPTGVVGVYDVTDDWIPLYDRTGLDGYYVAIGTSGHGFKQAPFVGDLMAQLIGAVESGHDHDRDPVQGHGSWTGVSVDLGHFSRRRRVVPQQGMDRRR